jgi:hypothetical protein
MLSIYHVRILHFMILIIFGEEYEFCYFLPFRSKYSSQHPSLALNLCYFFNVIGQASHTYKTTDKIIFLYILIFTFLTLGARGSVVG